MDLKVAQAKVQKFGATLSAMVMPNIGVFIGWGLLTALFIPTGWAPNKQLNELVGPILTYLLPALIGYTAGANIYGRRGGVIGAFATLGVIVGSSVTMLVGGMIMGPIGAILLKKFDKLVKGKVKPGMEMLVDNFSLGILGFILVILGFLAIAPIITGIQNFLSAGVNFMTKRDLIPLTSLFVQPAQILFLNNAINHGIMVPLGLQQAAEAGKSILFLVEANGAIWVGTALAFVKFGTGIAKKTAPGAAVIMFFGGIAEVVFPYCLMMPLTILGPMAGNIFSLTVLSLFGGGTVGPPSPGSVFAFYMMTPKSSLLVNSIAYFGALAVSFAVTGLILKFVRQPNASKMLSSFDTAAVATAGPAAPTVSEELQTAEKDDGIAVAPKNQLRHLNRIIFACDAGMGSSAMGASILSAELKKVGLSPEVDHMAVADIGDETSRADLIVTNESLEPRAEMMSKGSLPILTVKILWIEQNISASLIR
ncbi:PTS system, mannitol-specific IIBC components [Lacticaseibacillus paracasei]|nr:PTS system, mannitol-specific IIBC components [Lacticaseibacillus paracasei]